VERADFVQGWQQESLTEGEVTTWNIYCGREAYMYLAQILFESDHFSYFIHNHLYSLKKAGKLKVDKARKRQRK
jgi:hypothetical protein